MSPISTRVLPFDAFLSLRNYLLVQYILSEEIIAKRIYFLFCTKLPAFEFWQFSLLLKLFFVNKPGFSETAPVASLEPIVTKFYPLFLYPIWLTEIGGKISLLKNQTISSICSKMRAYSLLFFIIIGEFYVYNSRCSIRIPLLKT